MVNDRDSEPGKNWLERERERKEHRGKGRESEKGTEREQEGEKTINYCQSSQNFDDHHNEYGYKMLSTHIKTEC